jgi:hypothetical protein
VVLFPLLIGGLPSSLLPARPKSLVTSHSDGRDDCHNVGRPREGRLTRLVVVE